MNCHNCNKETDYTQRVNRPGVPGHFFCLECVDARNNDIAELFGMGRKQLDLVPYTELKWICCVVKRACVNGTVVRDYGAHPWYYRPAAKGEWFNLNHTNWLCGKHNKLWKRLQVNFDIEHCRRRMFEPNYRNVLIEKK